METKSLEHFKDWSNYLLVTTVAALGWVGTQGIEIHQPVIKSLCILSFALSIVFGIFTLALIPLIAEQVGDKQSIYDVAAKSNLLQRLGLQSIRLRTVCLPQHLLFLAGIVLYAVGTGLKMN